MDKPTNTFQDKISRALMCGGIILSISSGPTALYFDSIRPHKPPIAKEYQILNHKLDYHTTFKHYNLEEATNHELIQEQVRKADSLDAQIKNIEASQEYTKIAKYQEQQKQHDKYARTIYGTALVGVSLIGLGLYKEHLNETRNAQDTSSEQDA